MSVLRNLEAKLADLVEGTFGRVFRSEVRPVELARKLAREMDEHKTVSVSRTYVPNEYLVWLSPQDRELFAEVEGSLIEELSGYLLEHARRERLALLSRPQIEFRTDERLSLGEFGIQTRVVRPAEEAAALAPDAPHAVQSDHGNTMIYSTAGRIRGPGRGGAGHAPDARARARRGPAPRRRPGRRDDRAQPRLRHRPVGRERLAPSRRGAAGGGRRMDDLGSRLDERRARQRPPRRGIASCCSPATGSPWAPPRSGSSSNEPERPGERLTRCSNLSPSG